MVDFFSQIINGLAIGNVYALLAIGFALVFGVANLINFAQGSLFMLGGYLTFTGVSYLGLPLLPAALLGILLTTGIGVALDWACLRPIQRGPRIAPLLATLALAVIIDSTAELVWSPNTQGFPNPMADQAWTVGNAFISAVDLLILATGIVCIVSLTLFLKYTWTGRALRATAMDPEAAQQMGVNVAAMRTLTFGLAGLLGGIGGVLIGLYYQSIWPTMGIPFGLKGFTAALLGGISSIPGAIAGGLLLGIFESLTSGYLGSLYRNMVAYSLLLLVLFFRPQGLFGARGLDALGGAQAAAGMVPSTSLMASAFSPVTSRIYTLAGWPALAVLVLAVLYPFVADRTWEHIGTLAAIFSLLAVSLTVVAGSAGQISVGHAALFGVGAYTAALLGVACDLPIELLLVAAGTMGAIAAIACGVVAVRLSGHVIVMATLASGLILHSVFLSWIDVTRGPMGVRGIPPPSVGLLGGFSITDNAGHYWLSLAVLALALFLTGRLLQSNVGRTWRAIREDRLAAVAAGVPAVRYLLMAFAVSGFLAGAAGALYAHLLAFIAPGDFFILASFIVLTMVVLGGLGNLTGAVFGAVLLIVLTEVLREFGEFRMVAYGLVLLLAIMFRPNGLLGSK